MRPVQGGGDSLHRPWPQWEAETPDLAPVSPGLAVGSSFDVEPFLLPAPSRASGGTIRPEHWAELQASAIAPDVALANVASFGEGTGRHWEDERAELIAWGISEASTNGGERRNRKGWYGHGNGRYRPTPLAIARNLDRRYRHLQAGGWRSLSDSLPGLPVFDQWKPNQSRERHDKPGQWIKYEAPPSFPDGGGLLLPHVPERWWRLICQRQGLPFPDPATVAGGFSAWAERTPELRLLLCEGWKKALAAISAGWAAVALPGVQMGRRVSPDGSERLIPALRALACPGRRWLIAFDADAKPSTAAKVAAAAGALARTLRAAGGQVEIARLPLLPGTSKTGLDDLAAAAGIEALDRALADTGPRPVLPRLRPADLVAPAGQHLAAAVDLDTLAACPLLLVAAPMGSGKTRLAAALTAPHLAAGVPSIAPTHRTALGESQAEAVGLAWAPRPGTDERLQGLGLCWDSLRPSSGLQFRPEEWSGPDGRGPFVLLDEIAQGVEHKLFGTGTAVAQHRPETLATASALLRNARAVVGMDAYLSAPVLRLLETLTGHRATLLRSEAQPMAGRPVLVPQGLTARTAAEQGRARVLELAKAHRRVFVVTTAQQEHAKGSARNLARLVRRHWPDARVLVVDSEAPEAAEQLGAQPNQCAAAHDWIICSPSITSGLSIDAPGLFDEVLVIGAGGQLPCEHLAQAAARVRDPVCPVSIYAPAVAPQLRIGSGDTSHAALLEHLSRCESRLLAQLTAAGGWDPARNNESPWLRCYLEMAADRNRQSHAYALTVAGLLEAEGWAVSTAAPVTDPGLVRQAAAELEDIAEAATAAADALVIAADLPGDDQAAALQRKRRLTEAERVELKRWKIARRWGLGQSPPTPEILAADRDGMPKRWRFGWLLGSIDGRQLAARHDRRVAEQLAPDGIGWAPDLLRRSLGHRLAAADALGLPSWLERREWFPATDPQLLELQAMATAHRGTLMAALGAGPGKRASGTLRALLRLTGHRLEAKRERTGGGGRGWAYRVVPDPLPIGADPLQLESACRQWLTEATE